VSHMKRVLVITAAVLLYACGGIGGGGGGGGSGDNYTGDVWLDLESDHIDSGELMNVSVEVSGLNAKGSVLKFRTSRSLRFVKSSAIMFPARDEEVRISPDELVATEYERYIVFFLDPDQAIDGDYVSLTFTLKAVSGDEDGFIEVDLDNNDPNVADSREFQSSAARFTAKQRRSVYIEPDSSAPTPTPGADTTGTPTGEGTPTPAATATAAS
jgi:hypothetical protein